VDQQSIARIKVYLEALKSFAAIFVFLLIILPCRHLQCASRVRYYFGMDQFIKELEQAHTAFTKTVNNILARAHKTAEDDAKRLQSAAAGVFGKASAMMKGNKANVKDDAAPRGKRRGRRGRRTGDELKALAEAAVDIIKAGGKEGVMALDVKSKLDGITGSVKQFVELHSDYKIKQEGSKRHTRYHLA
jgi:hypothetical protein